MIVPTRNRLRSLIDCLDALAGQTAEPFEVIVVDDGSDQPVSLDASRWEKRFPLTVIRKENTGPAGARNRGAEAARGEFLAFTDDDCLPEPTWLDKLIGRLRKYPGTLVGGWTFNGLQDDLFATTSQLVVDMVYQHFNRDPENAYFLTSNNMACRKTDFLKIGGFDLSFQVASEDREFCDRWRMGNHRLLLVRDALIEHRHAQDLPGFARLHFRYGQGAFEYQHLRKRRRSGSIGSDLRFHRALPSLVRKNLHSATFGTGAPLLASLTLWQVFNAMGFFWAAGANLFFPK